MPHHRTEDGGQLVTRILGEASLRLKLVRHASDCKPRLAPSPRRRQTYRGPSRCHIDARIGTKRVYRAMHRPIAHVVRIIRHNRRTIHGRTFITAPPAQSGFLARGAHTEQRVLGEFIGDRLQIRGICPCAIAQARHQKGKRTVRAPADQERHQTLQTFARPPVGIIRDGAVCQQGFHGVFSALRPPFSFLRSIGFQRGLARRSPCPSCGSLR